MCSKRKPLYDTATFEVLQSKWIRERGRRPRWRRGKQERSRRPRGETEAENRAEADVTRNSLNLLSLILVFIKIIYYNKMLL